MFKLIALWMLLLISFVVPPLMFVSIPLLVIYIIRVRRRVRYLRASRDYFLDEQAIHTVARGLK